jgi:hypothetical protein
MSNMAQAMETSPEAMAARTTVFPVGSQAAAEEERKAPE